MAFKTKIGFLTRATAAALSGTIVLAAPVASAETIYQALALAYDSNPALNAQRAATRSVDEKVPQAKSFLRPQVNFAADLGFSSRTTNAPGLPTIKTQLRPYGFRITIDQSLFRGFRTVNTIKSARANVRASRETLRNVEQNTLFNAASAYADVVQAQRILRLRQSNISFLSEQVRSANARLEVGEGTRTDVAQSDAQLALARAQAAAAQASLASSRAVYREVVGRSPRHLRDPAVPHRLLPHSLDDAILSAVVSHPSVKVTQHLLDAAAFNVKTTEGELLPTLSARAQTQRRFNNQQSGDRTTTSTATVNLTVPLYQGGAVASRVREGKQVVGQRRIEVDQARDTVRRAVVDAWSQLISARASITSGNAQVRAARLALNGVVEERNVGQRTQLDVLEAQSNLLNAQISLTQARRNRVVAAYGLLSAVGRLNSQRLGLQVRHYSPVAHFDQVKDKWYGLRTPSGR
ncbi:MAG: TolC family outer membrane protein [Pseudomonadota bacterium]